MPEPALCSAHPGNGLDPADKLRLLEQGPIGRAVPPHRKLQQPAEHTSIDNRLTTLENSGGIAPTADLTVNSVTAASFLDTPELRSSAGDLQIQNALVTVGKEDGALLASFADGGISLDRDVTAAAASTFNATTADFAQFFVGSTAATGAFSPTAASPPTWRSRATSGSRPRWCAAIRREPC